MGSRLPAILLALCALALADARAGDDWTDATLAEIPEFSLTDSAMRIDAAGRPHVFVGGDRVYHYWLPPAAVGWLREVVDARARSGTRLRVATGPSGEFHLVYQLTERTGEMNPRSQLSPYDPPPTVTTLRYATNLSGQWVIETITGAPSLVASGLAVDANHVPHLLLDQVGAPELLGVRSSGQWSFEAIAPDFPGATASPYQTPDPSVGSGLQIDAAGNLHAIWFPSGDPYAPGIVYAKRSGTVWQAQKIESAAGKVVVPVRPWVQLVLDGAGNPHIFANAGSGFVQDTYPFSGGWTQDLFGDELHGAFAWTAAVDAAGQLHALALSSSGGNGFMQIDHYAKSGITWNRELAHGSIPIDNGAHLALASDASGGLHGVYLGDNSKATSPLQYLHRDTTWSWTVIGRDSLLRLFGGPVGDTPSVGADVRIGLVGTSRRLIYRYGGLTSSGQPIEARTEVTSGDFAFEPVADQGNTPGTLAFAVDASGNERALFPCGGMCEVIRSPEGVWQMITPGNDQPHWAMRPGIAFDAGGALHSAFTTPVNSVYTAVHAVDTNQRLLTEVISPELATWIYAGPPGTLAMAPGPLGSMVVAGLGGDGIWVGSNATGQWVGSSVPFPDNVPFSLEGYALAVSGDGVVHLAVQGPNTPGFNPHPSLLYGNNACGGFYLTEVDPLVRALGPTPQDPVVGSRNPDIALDPLGNPHISYRREADHSLGYAHVIDGKWTTETVVGDTSAGEESAIAVDPNGVVSIAYHDDWAGDLHLATRAPLSAQTKWDGCPALPDPNALRDGTFVFAPPADALPLYDPTDEYAEASYGPGHLYLHVFATPGGKIYTEGTGSITGESMWGASAGGGGKVKGKGGRVSVKQALRAAENDAALVKIVRVESVDALTGARTLDERVTGKIHGQKVDFAQHTSDVVPAHMLGLRLELEIQPGKKNALVATATWARGSYQETTFTGKGAWSPSTESADLVLKAKGGGSLKLKDVRIWKSQADGIHLSASRATGSLLGQKIDVDLTSAFAPASAPRAAASSGR